MASSVVKDRLLKANHNYHCHLVPVIRVVKDRLLKANHNGGQFGVGKDYVVKDRLLKANHNAPVEDSGEAPSCQRSFVESKSQPESCGLALRKVVKDRLLKANHNLDKISTRSW